jgi:hypothetical protein
MCNIRDERGGILIWACGELYIWNRKVESNPWTTLKIGARDEKAMDYDEGTLWSWRDNSNP